MPAVTTQLDTSGISAMCDDLAKMSGQTWEHVVVDQTLALLRVALKYTPAAPVGKIISRVKRANENIGFSDGTVVAWLRRANAYAFLDVSTFRPRKGHSKPQQLINGKSWHLMDSHHRWSADRNARFARFQAEAALRRKDVAKAVLARGLAKATWLQIADDLGIDIHPAAYVRSAKPSNGKFYKNGTALKLLSAAAAFIDIRNDNPGINDRLNGESIMKRAISTRLRAFQIETEKGVFGDVAARAKRYPGIFTNN
ncbi:MAG: hypothetical protein JWL59_1339 [Chthoniobacteraceae bacterium]|nr:hypothetical protein [Chthoniobacteraceae bacterium]